MAKKKTAVAMCAVSLYMDLHNIQFYKKAA